MTHRSLPHTADIRIAFEMPHSTSPPTDRMTTNTRMRPNQVWSSWPCSQESERVPIGGPKYSDAQIAKSSVAIDSASFTKPRIKPMITERAIATAMMMSMIGMEEGSKRGPPACGRGPGF